MNKVFFFMAVLFLFTAFGYREPDYCKIVDQITKKYLKECATSHRLILSGYGGAMMNDIQEISLRFLSFDAMNIDEARILYVEMMEEFLQRINNHEKVRPYLHTFPFIIENIKLDISFVNSDGLTKKDGHVAFMYIGKNKNLFYKGCDPETEDFYSLHRESYEEALKKVKGHYTETSDRESYFNE